MTTRAVAALGITQCVNWGVLYYAFAVLVVPLQRELGVATWTVTGAFSLALLASAAMAPAIGRRADRGDGAWVMQSGAAAAIVLLIVWTLLPRGVLALYVVWAGLGLCMAATLYEPAFVIVARAFDDPSKQLRALAGVTVFGGAASTVFLPLTAFLVDAIGWRGAVLVLASLLAMSAVMARVLVFAHLPAPRRAPPPSPRAAPGEDVSADAARFPFVAACFALVSAASAGFAANLVPALGTHGASPATAAMLGALMGAMQIPGRAWLLTGALSASPVRLLAISLVLHALGLLAVAAGPSLPIVAAGMMTFALGSGLSTLVRPHLVQTLFMSGTGHLNGRVARYQQLARAAAPLSIAWLAGLAGYGAVFLGIAGGFAVLAAASRVVLARRVGASIDLSERLLQQRGDTRVAAVQTGAIMTDAIRTPSVAAATLDSRSSIQPMPPAPTGCCGGPAPAGTDGCCGLDAEMKSAGGDGCGCGTTAAAPAAVKTGCCG